MAAPLVWGGAGRVRLTESARPMAGDVRPGSDSKIMAAAGRSGAGRLSGASDFSDVWSAVGVGKRTAGFRGTGLVMAGSVTGTKAAGTAGWPAVSAVRRRKRKAVSAGVTRPGLILISAGAIMVTPRTGAEESMGNVAICGVSCGVPARDKSTAATNGAGLPGWVTALGGSISGGLSIGRFRSITGTVLGATSGRPSSIRSGVDKSR